MTAEIEQKDGRYLVALDGHKIENIKSVYIQLNRDELPVITMSVYADDIRYVKDIPHMSKT